MTWTEKETEQLKQLVKEGLTAGQIAKATGKTRNGVIGKLRRLGVPLAGATAPDKDVPARVRDKKIHYPPKRKPTPVAKVPAPVAPDETVDLSTHLSLKDDLGKVCQWYFGDPRAGDFSKCNHPSFNGSHYCEHHYHRVYAPREIRGARPK